MPGSVPNDGLVGPAWSRISVPEWKSHLRIGMSSRSNVRQLVREYGLHSSKIDVERLEKKQMVLNELDKGHLDESGYLTEKR